MTGGAVKYTKLYLSKPPSLTPPSSSLNFEFQFNLVLKFKDKNLR